MAPVVDIVAPSGGVDRPPVMAPHGGVLWPPVVGMSLGAVRDPCTIELVILVGFQIVIFVVQFESRDLKFCTAGGLAI